MNSWWWSWWNPGEILVKSWWNLGEILVNSRWNLGEILVKSWWNLGELLVKSWWNLGEIKENYIYFIFLVELNIFRRLKFFRSQVFYIHCIHILMGIVLILSRLSSVDLVHRSLLKQRLWRNFLLMTAWIRVFLPGVVGWWGVQKTPHIGWVRAESENFLPTVGKNWN